MTATTGYAVVAADEFGATVDARGDDAEVLADKVASWAQQETDKWPDMGLVYMLVPADDTAGLEG